MFVDNKQLFLQKTYYMDTKNILSNYMDTFYFCHLENSHKFDKYISSHFLAYIYSGEMILLQDGKKEILRKGETVFIKRNHQMQKIKQPTVSGEPFKALFIELKTPFLKKFLSNNKHLNHTSSNISNKNNYIYLEEHPFLSGFFASLEHYFGTNIYPTKELMDSKLNEAVLVLLQLREELKDTLFDFSGTWKIDLVEFMEHNYRSDLSIEEFAHFTGRSLSGFKRDFSNSFNTTPTKWIINKRLELAHSLLSSNSKQVSEICYEVGFKNLSHFSSAFKKRYGFAPTKLLKQI